MTSSYQIVNLNLFEPARIGWRQARGQKFSCDFYFLDGSSPTPAKRDISGANPQLVFLPRSRSGAWGYDLAVTDPVGGTAHLDVDGAFFNDPKGYTTELYFRDANGAPTQLVGLGRMAMTGGAYAYEGPLGPMTLPVVQGPAGPAGPMGATGIQGDQGTRGSMWFTGHGSPTVIGEVVGDMYLDVDTGDIWRWNGLGSWERA